MKSKLLIVATINIFFLMLLSGCSNSKSSDIQVGTSSKATSIFNEKTNSQPKQSIIQSKPDMDFSSYTGDWVCKEKATSIEIKVDSLGNVTGSITTVVDSHVPSSSIEGIIKGGILTSKLLVDDADSGTLVLSFKESKVLIGNVKLDKDIDYWTLEQGDMRFIRYSDVDNNNNENLINSDTTGIGKSETLKQLQDKGFQLIPEQSFDVNLENWGNVKFVSGFQDDNFKIPKLGLYLTDSNGTILYSFPEFYGNIWVLFDVDAVAFKDANGDGLKDIIIIADYILGHGENAAEEFPVSGVYFQIDKKFINLAELDEEMNNKRINESISQVLKYVDKMQIDINNKLGVTTRNDFTPNFVGIKEIMN